MCFLLAKCCTSAQNQTENRSMKKVTTLRGVEECLWLSPEAKLEARSSQLAVPSLFLHSFIQKIKEALKNITSHVDRPVRGFIGRCAILIIWACAHMYEMFNRMTEELIEATTPKHCFPYHIPVIHIPIMRRRRPQ